ncbi:MAG: hypothetical protein J4432_00315 [DPANN group archaeon]|nr:hypothetical protein [DPANN group archaeon]
MGIDANVNKACRQISRLEIQGATNTALYALASLKKAKFTNLKSNVRALRKTRPTEPLMLNGLAYISQGSSQKEVTELADKYKILIEKSHAGIAKHGQKIVNRKHTVLTHCHSSTVEAILKTAKPRAVIATETRPLYQGHITARNLAKHKINVTQVVDSAANAMMKNADVVIVGCDAITKNASLINKIGTSGVALSAGEHGVPFYAATSLLKYDLRNVPIEYRDPREVWANPPRGVKILNPSFDITESKFITSFITEKGLLKPRQVPKMAMKTYPWIIR